MTQKTLRSLLPFLTDPLEKIQRDIAALYARFGAENKLSPAEARRLIRGDEFTVWRMTLEEYVKAAKGDSAILKELNTLAMRSRISRFEALHARTLMELADLCEKLERFEDAFQYRAYIANFYGNLYDIHKQYGLSTPPVAVDKNQAEKVVRTAWSGANYSTRIWKNATKLESAIKETMLTAIHRGTSIQKLSTDLSRRMQVGYNDAERLIRTELNYVQTRAAAREKAKRNPDPELVKGKQILDKLGRGEKLTPAPTLAERLVQNPNISASLRQSAERVLAASKGDKAHYPPYATSKGVSTGGITGALNPESPQANAHAIRYYGLVRSMRTDCRRIAKNTGFREEDIQRIKNHVFYEEHELYDGEIARFEPSYHMAQSWQRLIDGRSIQERDILLLNHEFLESVLMSEGLVSYIAHEKA